jgi:hypothetical protein
MITSLGIGGIKFSKNVANNNHGYPIVYIIFTSQVPIDSNIFQKVTIKNFSFVIPSVTQ